MSLKLSTNECNGNFSSVIPRNAAESLVCHTQGIPIKVVCWRFRNKCGMTTEELLLRSFVEKSNDKRNGAIACFYPNDGVWGNNS